MGMKQGVCPQCSSRKVHVNTNVLGKAGAYGGNAIPITAWSGVALDNYVCVDCGYVELYISDVGALRKIAENWPKANKVKSIHIKHGIRTRISPLLPGLYEREQ
jgi:hypothetical protein